MEQRDRRYCYNCSRQITDRSTQCRNCWAPVPDPANARVAGIAFLLDELDSGRMLGVLTDAQRETLRGEYQAALSAFFAPPARPAAVAAPPPRAVVSQDTALAAGTSAPHPREPASATGAHLRATPVRPSQPPAPPPVARAPYDWSWLVEQQANLFLFAGAFLTVVAALIYVGYSGQAVDGALKMTLLTLYTCAFLVAGGVCLRIPRVQIAGQVFFAVGAIFVPLNFVAARSILADETLSRTTMWLAGSSVTAAFYTAVASLGLGKQYSFGAGLALASATLAAAIRLDIAIEWVPVCFIALAILMSLADLVAPQLFRTRVAAMWAAQSQVIAAVAMIAAIAIAPWAAGYGDVSTASRAFLPLSFAGFAAFATMSMLGRGRAESAVLAIAGFSGAFISIVYAARLPSEDYVVAFGALAVLLGIVASLLARTPAAARVPGQLDRVLRSSGVAATAIAGFAAFAVISSSQSERGYAVNDHWFLAAAFALVFAYYMIEATARRREEGLAGASVALAGFAAALVYGLGLAHEDYAVAFGISALVLGLAAAAVLDARLASRLPATARDVLRVAGVVATLTAAVVVALILMAAYGNAKSYAIESRWFVLAAAAPVLAFYLLDTLRLRERSGVAGAALAFAAGIAAVAYALALPAEDYAIAAGIVAVVLVVALAATRTRAGIRLAPAGADLILHAAMISATIASAILVAILLLKSGGSHPSYAVEQRAFVAITVALALAAYAVDAFAMGRQEGALGTGVSWIALGAGVVYALDVSSEYYAFGLLAPAATLAAPARFAAHRHLSRLADTWRDDAFVVAEAAAVGGVLIAIVAAIAGTGSGRSFHPDSHAFLPCAFAVAVTVAAIDASRARRPEASAAVLLAIAGAMITIAYALRLDAQYYAVMVAATAGVFALGGRVYTPDWLDTGVRDVLAAIAITIAWLPFEGVYLHHAQIGAGVHLAAACFYGAAAFSDMRALPLGGILDLPAGTRVKLSIGWLYAAGATVTLGYLHLLNALPGDETVADALHLGYPLLVASVAFAVLGMVAKRRRPDFRLHLYIMSLLAALISLSTPADALNVAVLLTAYVCISAAIAVYENRPALAIPAAVFGFAAVPAWRVEADAALFAIPLAYSMIALALAALSIALQRRTEWRDALRAGAGAYGAAAPVAGFGLLYWQTHRAHAGATPFQETALYSMSAASLAIAGAMASADGVLSGRRWLIVPGTAIVTSALLLAIGHFDPRNPQPYTAVIGGYLLALGLLGLWKLRLIPEWAASAQYVEAAGAAVIMIPTMVQSLDAGLPYEWILLLEAASFFTLGVTLRRRGILGAAIVALVLVAGRALFDAVNALPNWVVVMVAGMALLGIGMLILIGRDRWSRWQESIAGWWDATEEPAA